MLIINNSTNMNNSMVSKQQSINKINKKYSDHKLDIKRTKTPRAHNEEDNEINGSFLTNNNQQVQKEYVKVQSLM